MYKFILKSIFQFYRIILKEKDIPSVYASIVVALSITFNILILLDLNIFNLAFDVLKVEYIIGLIVVHFLLNLKIIKSNESEFLKDTELNFSKFIIIIYCIVSILGTILYIYFVKF